MWHICLPKCPTRIDTTTFQQVCRSEPANYSYSLYRYFSRNSKYYKISICELLLTEIILKKAILRLYPNAKFRLDRPSHSWDKVNATVCDPVSVCGRRFFIFLSVDEANDKKAYDNHYKHYPDWIKIWIDVNCRCEFWIFFKWIPVFDVNVTSGQW